MSNQIQNSNSTLPSTHIAIFKGKQIRKTLFKNEWWFSVVDVVEALTDSVNSNDYWYKMKIRVKDEDQIELSTICRQLKLLAPDGKMRETDCANTEGVLRIIQSIPSPKAEPFKRWLARVGYERIQEIEDPELASKRAKTLYKLKGYPENWIEKRMRGIAVRNELTDEWDKRGAENQKENLRDHMNDLELILAMLGEQTTTEIHRKNDSQGLLRLKDDAREGGQIAGSARKQIERRLGRPIVSKDNFLPKKGKRNSEISNQNF